MSPRHNGTRNNGLNKGGKSSTECYAFFRAYAAVELLFQFAKSHVELGYNLNITKYQLNYGRSFDDQFTDRKVQVSKDQEKAQSEKDSHSKNRGGKKPN